jgi:hypothetical protein
MEMELKRIKVKLANGDELSFIGIESTHGGAYCVQTKDSVFTVMASHFMWVSTSDYVPEYKDDNVQFVDFNKDRKL